MAARKSTGSGGGRRGGGSRRSGGDAARRRRSSAQRKAPARRRRPARRGGKRGWTPQRFRTWARYAAAVAFVGGFATASWVISLDRIVLSRFEGRRFEVPSKVLSAPTILYPGLDAKHIDLRGTLLRLGYRELPPPTSSAVPEGRFRWGAGRLRVHLRAFSHPSRPEPARDIVMRFRGDRISEMRELPRGREVGAVLLEPELVGAFYGSEREQRQLVALEQVPRHLIDAVLSVEDRRFEEHHGLDFRRILGAALANLRAGSVQQGGSTLTQQLVKNFFLTPERTLSRKAQEAVMALLVEARYDKAQILQAYLNEIYFGQRGSTSVHGVGEASHFLFGKRAEELSVADSALLAAIIQSPNRLSPHRNPDDATRRRNLVLDLMFGQKRIDRDTYEAARVEPMRVAAIAAEAGDARYFLDVLRRQLPEVYDEELLAVQGLSVYSTLDIRLQRIAARALIEGLQSLEKRHARLARSDPSQRLQGCLIALRPQTGEILALVGGRSYGVSQFDRCTQARRQVGSVFKPFVYAAALEPRRAGPVITLASIVDDDPLEVDTPSGPWQPQNFDKEFHGRVPVREAVERSFNVAAARLGQDVGIDRVADMARRLGVTSALPRVPSLALGTASVAPIEIASAYATLANGGVRAHAHAFEDVVQPEGGTLERRDLRLERVIDSGTAFLTTSLLRGVVDRGTGAGVRAMGLEGPVAGKTGTTDDTRDLWFAGFTRELVAVVWVGFDQPASTGLSGASGALPIWARFMRDAFGGKVVGDFLPPPEVQRVDVHPTLGAVALTGCPERRAEYFLPGTEPEVYCTRSGLRRDDPRRSRRRRGIFDWIWGDS